MKFNYSKEELYNYGATVVCALCKEKHYLSEPLRSHFKFLCHNRCSEIVFYYNSNLNTYVMTLWRYYIQTHDNTWIYISYFNSYYPNKIYVDINTLDGAQQYKIPYTDFYNLDDKFFNKIKKQVVAKRLLI